MVRLSDTRTILLDHQLVLLNEYYDQLGRIWPRPHQVLSPALALQQSATSLGSTSLAMSCMANDGEITRDE